jgi:hypothetical protein
MVKDLKTHWSKLALAILIAYLCVYAYDPLQVNTAAQYDVPYYSASGTANLLSGAAITGLQLDSTSGAPAAYGGTTCAANTALTALSASGAQTCSSFVNAAGTGLSLSTHTLSSNAEWNYLARIQTTTLFANGTPFDIVKVKNASTLDSCTASVASQTCTTAQTYAIVDCGSSTTCASPTTLCSIQVTSAVTAFQVASPAQSAIAAGDYIAGESLTGACTANSTGGIQGQIHSN